MKNQKFKLSAASGWSACLPKVEVSALRWFNSIEEVGGPSQVRQLLLHARNQRLTLLLSLESIINGLCCLQGKMQYAMTIVTALQVLYQHVGRSATSCERNLQRAGSRAWQRAKEGKCACFNGQTR